MKPLAQRVPRKKAGVRSNAAINALVIIEMPSKYPVPFEFCYVTRSLRPREREVLTCADGRLLVGNDDANNENIFRAYALVVDGGSLREYVVRTRGEQLPVPNGPLERVFLLSAEYMGDPLDAVELAAVTDETPGGENRCEALVRPACPNVANSTIIIVRYAIARIASYCVTRPLTDDERQALDAFNGRSWDRGDGEPPAALALLVRSTKLAAESDFEFSSSEDEEMMEGAPPLARFRVHMPSAWNMYAPRMPRNAAKLYFFSANARGFHERSDSDSEESETS